MRINDSINGYPHHPVKKMVQEGHLFSDFPDVVQSFKAIGDPTRLRILALLTAGELCVCDIMAVLDLPQSTASRHLAYLKNSHWVIGVRSGKWMHYRLHPELQQSSLHGRIVSHISALAESRSDRRKLDDYLKTKESRPDCK